MDLDACMFASSLVLFFISGVMLLLVLEHKKESRIRGMYPTKLTLTGSTKHPSGEPYQEWLAEFTQGSVKFRAYRSHAQAMQITCASQNRFREMEQWAEYQRMDVAPCVPPTIVKTPEAHA